MQFYQNKIFIILFIIVLAQGKLTASDSLIIYKKHITFDSVRKVLSLDYLSNHYNIKKTYPSISPKIVVVHWTGFASLNESFERMDPVLIASERSDIKSASLLNVSAHYLIDLDGTIYQLMPDTLFARHTIGLNHCAIGIENVGDGANTPLTKTQVKANAALVLYLTEKYNIKHVIGHYEYKKFRGHSLWKEKDNNYLTSKIDPGKKFMSLLKKRVALLKSKKERLTIIKQ